MLSLTLRDTPAWPYQQMQQSSSHQQSSSSQQYSSAMGIKPIAEDEAEGRAMQVEPMQPMFKAPGTMRLKL